MPEEHPIVKLLREDRKIQDAEVTESVKDNHTTMTYLGAGALGFFLTIHEKFFALPQSKLFWLFVVSIALLFLSLLLYLAHLLFKFIDSGRIRDEADRLITEFDFENSTEDEQNAANGKLNAIWKNADTTSRVIMFARLILVLLGLAGEIIFMTGNFYLAKTMKEKPGTIRIEIPASENKGSLSIDTSQKSTIQIRF